MRTCCFQTTITETENSFPNDLIRKLLSGPTIMIVKPYCITVVCQLFYIYTISCSD